jgi:hypothetical protein
MQKSFHLLPLRYMWHNTCLRSEYFIYWNCTVTALNVRFRLCPSHSTSRSPAKQFTTKNLRLTAPNTGLLVGLNTGPPLLALKSKFKPAHGSESNHYAASDTVQKIQTSNAVLRSFAFIRPERKNMSYNLHCGNTKQRPVQRNFKTRCNVLRVTLPT